MLTFQRMDSLLLGSLVNTAEIIPKVWVSTSSKQNLHHAGRNQKEKSVKSRKGRGSRGPDSEACLEIGSASAPVSGTAGKNINAVNVKDNGRETGSENLLAEALDKLTHLKGLVSTTIKYKVFTQQLFVKCLLYYSHCSRC